MQAVLKYTLLSKSGLEKLFQAKGLFGSVVMTRLIETPLMFNRSASHIQSNWFS